ncbi:unnamed protein product [Paramecium sonneborni]|uniref:Uncharacterized protein n=1 Tax=Paramecium sonneborni TaxID=65129 RepID=A0A8S1RNB6_9CILI|nr:unnamed protein product [Paramecium sonneborni]
MKIQLKQKIQDYQQRIILITKRRGIIQKDQLIEALQNYQDLVHLNRQYSLAFIRIVQNNIKLLGRAMRLQAIIMIN